MRTSYRPLRLLRGLAVATAFATAALACGGGGGGGGANLAKDQVFRVNDGTEPVTLDPQQQQYDYEAAVDRVAFEPLLRPRPDLSDVEPAAASKWDVSADGLTWTFHLRDNKWSDGQPVKAQDFVTAFQRILDPRIAAPYADPFFDGTIKGAEKYGDLDPKKDADKIPAFIQGLGVKATDDKTFVVQLQNPTPYFKWIATLWVGAPTRQDAVQKAGDKFGVVAPDTVNSLPSNGPFKFAEVAPKDHISLVPNPNWTGPKPTLTKITYYFISDANQDFARYQNGEEDQVSVPLANTDLVRNDANLSKQLTKTSQLNTFWINFNNKKAPFDNPKLREAFAKAIDRDKLVNDVLKTRGTATSVFIPKGQNGYDDSLSGLQKFDPAGAKAALQACGCQAALANVKLLVRNTTTNVTIGQFIQDQLKTNLGVSIPIDSVESKTVSQRLNKGDFQVFALSGWGADYPDPQDWFDIYLCGSGNQTGTNYCNKDYDAAVKKADSEAKDSDRLT